MSNQSDKNALKIKLVKAMLSHVPFDGWTWLALDQGAIDINFENKLNFNERMKIYKNLFNEGPIDFIEIFSDMIDDEMEKNYNSLVSKPERIPHKIKTIILMRLDLSQKYKEAVRSSIALTVIPKNSIQSSKFLYRTCNKIWKMVGDKSTDFSFYTKRFSLGAVYTSTLLFWLNDTSNKLDQTADFLDRRLQNISKISDLKKPLATVKKLIININNNKKSFGISSVFDVFKKLNNIKKSSFNKKI